ncbi:MAG: 16S rRNA (adenine(1518)-N(6)/adenine(1519)-N(6))-dimethyltransferase RsmA [Sphingomonadaceae bacterium]|nr:16S rRNA (adenine(1518)-N(6)/adenine(1519)-N(6))-dimethyltransferase RsmA [Thermaurantiacus sp.]MCS6986696.1 16S rRNA (adenine(1518)-N(6)/adenine(1519)-N(6))-dimethyltransferase RsmA [Sphingomonadaceae bacterium]MDW8414041.1 16S rRNA (adenine(1518)-N(6)/adenine(1519)-N(6))-dimethyltransferase RsmA [Thermaurantiacus sp.]
MAADLDSLPPLREVIRAAGLSARRHLGQNFLLDLNLLDRIARLVPLRPGDTVYEVGPGPGGLTRALLKAGARVVAVERDPRAIAALSGLAAAAGPRLELIEGDALALDAAALAGPGAHIAANLPYHIGTALLMGWLAAEPWPPWWRSATLMFQREVAERIVATPGTPAYGRLSVLAQFRTRVRIRLRLPPQAFTPAPQVESAVVQLLPVAPAAPVPFAALAEATRLAFGRRRKTLRNALGRAAGALAVAGIDPARRAETLTVAEFARLAQALATG